MKKKYIYIYIYSKKKKTPTNFLTIVLFLTMDPQIAFLENHDFDVCFFFFINCKIFIKNIKLIEENIHFVIFKCNHKFHYNKNVICVKVSKNNDFNLFNSEYEIGKFFRKFSIFYLFIH
jgi:hypothetical protein